MKKLINAPGEVVREMMEGLAISYPGLTLLAGETVAIRSDAAAVRTAGKVALISGGGAGHEPAHAGYVGPGMLTAAVSGDVFTSPPTDAVLAAIRAVGGPAGVLLIVKNYTGDRLHFGLAAELARAEGIPCELVVVADDVALAASGDLAGRRGIAGTVFVHKIAGAAAEAGLSLAAVKAEAEAAAAAVGTMGVALSPCTVPAVGKPGFELGAAELELGLGIHGEAGVQRSTMRPVDELVDTIVERVVADRRFVKGDRVALLANNLGGTPAMEMALVTRRAVRKLTALGLRVERAWTGPLLTAIEMAGCSLSVMKLDDARMARLDARSEAPAWPAPWLGRVAVEPAQKSVDAKPAARTAGGARHPEGAQKLGAALKATVAAWRAHETRLTEMDRVVGDGDLGISLARGAAAIEAGLQRYDLADPAGTLREVAAALRKAIAGSSGALYAIGLMRAAATLDSEKPSAAAWAKALAAGHRAISDTGGAVVGDRTMLDALVPAAEALAAGVASKNGGAALRDALAAARAGAERTKAMKPRRGRSAYLAERAVGHPDPGAEAVVVWLEALTALWS